MAKLIELTQGHSAIVDDEDYEWLNLYLWQMMWNKCTKTFYARRSATIVGPHPKGVSGRRKRKTILMHTAITGYEITDHKNHDTLDNRRDNLRDATKLQNNRNTKMRSDNSVGLKGVKKLSTCERWMANINVNKKRIYLGSFKTPQEAHEAYMNAAIEHFGEFANAG